MNRQPFSVLLPVVSSGNRHRRGIRSCPFPANACYSHVKSDQMVRIEAVTDTDSPVV